MKTSKRAKDEENKFLNEHFVFPWQALTEAVARVK